MLQILSFLTDNNFKKIISNQFLSVSKNYFFTNILYNCFFRMEQERVFRRVCHTRGISLDAIKNLSDEEIIRQFWHHLKVADLNNLNPFAIDDCEAIVEKMKHRETRNER